MRIATRALPALAAAAFAVAPSAAQAATVTPDKACYVPRETALLTGTGFTEGARIDFIQEARLLDAPAPTFVGGDGVFVSGLRAPALPAGERVDHLTAVEVGGSGLKAGFNLKITARAVGVRPLIGPAGLRRRVLVRGFTGAPELYAHIVRRGSATARTIRVGALRGACGKLNLRKRLFGTRARPGRYRVQFDAAPEFSLATRPRVVRRVTLVRVAGRPRPFEIWRP